jgi:peptidoglycan/xylan/chitin deacetylase (PgdA/CDA1 family)
MEKSIAGRLERDDICLTFDDSLLCQKELAVPVLESLGYTGLFFVYSGVFQGGIEKLEIHRKFRNKHFENIEIFYDSFFRNLEESESGDAYIKAVKDFRPELYLSDKPFYSDNDRKFRFVRDKVIDGDTYNLVMENMIEETTSIEELSQSLWMNDNHLRELTRQGHVVGLHSQTHPTILGEMPPESQKLEYGKNFAHLEEVLGAPPQSVAHPCNSYNAATLDILAGLGVRVGFRDNMSNSGTAGLEYPREDHANIVAMMGETTS